NSPAPSRSTRSGVSTRPTPVLTPRSRANAMPLSDARRVSGTGGAGVAATSGSAMVPRFAGPVLLGELPPPYHRAVVRLHLNQRHPRPPAADTLPAPRLSGPVHGPHPPPGSEPRVGGPAAGEGA